MAEFYRWTRSAIECYLRGCKCRGCQYEEFFRTSVYKCKMKEAVFCLVRKYGAPTESMLHNLENYEDNI